MQAVLQAILGSDGWYPLAGTDEEELVVELSSPADARPSILVLWDVLWPSLMPTLTFIGYRNATQLLVHRVAGHSM